ncbi:MAG: RidA family protein [Myxococcaceae bacterium]
MNRLLALLLLLAVPALAAPPATPAKPTRKQVLVPGTGPAPLSSVVRAGELVFVSGQLGFPAGSRDLVPGGVGPETQAALEGVARNLAKVGLTMEDVVKCTVFLADIADFQTMNGAYTKAFPTDPPARSTVAVAGLVAKAKVEIECIAVTR